MSRSARILLWYLFLASISPVLAKEVPTVESWSDYRSRLEAKGMTSSEARARAAENLEYLKSMDRTAGDDRIGIVAPPFQFDGWLNSPAITLEDLRGQVVLVRWWTDTCPFCASSAPALRSIHDKYGPRGLTLLGVFHPKFGRDDPLDLERVKKSVERRQFEFPIAIDWDWRQGTLREWWLTGPDRPATSVTFLLDKQGVIQFVHPGMEYHDENGLEEHAMCIDDMTTIRAAIERLLSDPA